MGRPGQPTWIVLEPRDHSSLPFVVELQFRRKPDQAAEVSSQPALDCQVVLEHDNRVVRALGYETVVPADQVHRQRAACELLAHECAAIGLAQRHLQLRQDGESPLEQIGLDRLATIPEV